MDEFICPAYAGVNLTVSNGLTTEGGAQFEHVLLVEGEYVGKTLECVFSDSRSLA